MPGMVSTSKPHHEETSELKVSVGLYLRTVRGFCLNDLANHSAIKVFYQAVPFQQSFNHFLKISMRENGFRDQKSLFHTPYYILISKIHNVLGNEKTLEIPQQ